MNQPGHVAADLVSAAKSLGPAIRASRVSTEQARTPPGRLVDEMTTAGMFSLWLAKDLGGPQLDFAGFLDVIEQLASADGSVGWCAMVAAVFSRLSGYLDPGVADEVFARGAHRLAGSVNPIGKAVAVDRGYRVTGRWSYGSFIGHSHWTVGNCVVHDGDAPRRDQSGAPDIRFMLVPTSAVEIIDNWVVMGLRGTGSHDFVIRDVFVPEHRSVPAFTAMPKQPGALYAAPMITVFAAAVACVSLGIARAAIDAFVELAGAKTPMGSATLLRDRASAQTDLARAEGLIRAGRAHLVNAMSEIWREAEAGRPLSLQQRAQARIAAAQAAEFSARAVDLVFNAGGGTAIFEMSPIERCFRDVHATTQHIATSAHNYELAGRVLLGLDPGTPRF